jgi:hypothetical protein
VTFFRGSFFAGKGTSWSARDGGSGISRVCFPGANDLGNMFQFKHDFNEIYCGARDLNFARSINPELKTFADWLAKNKDRISLEKDHRPAYKM